MQVGEAKIKSPNHHNATEKKGKVSLDQKIKPECTGQHPFRTSHELNLMTVSAESDN